MKLAMFNLGALALIGAAFGEGWVQMAMAGGGPVMWVLVAVFTCGLWATWQARPVALRRTADALVKLGLIGTVFGFIIAMRGIDPDSAGDVTKASGMVAQLVYGMGVALYTTLAGSVLALWLTVNRYLIHE